MKKYIEPELVCRSFARISILTDSETETTYMSSMKRLKLDIQKVNTLNTLPIAEDSWNKQQ